MVVVARDEKYQEHDDILSDGNTRPNVRYDVVAMMRAQNDAAIGKEEVARSGVHQVDHIEHMQVYVGRHRAVNQPVEERKERKAAEEYDGADAAVDITVEFQIRAQKLSVVVRDWLVHRAYNGFPEAKLGKHEDAEYRTEQSVQTEICRAKQPQEQRTVEKRKQQPYAARCGIGDYVPLYILPEVELHVIS